MSDVNKMLPWSNLKMSIAVTSGSSRLYANGRQQVKLTVKLEAEDSLLNPAALSESELSSLRLIEYHGGKEIAFDNSTHPSANPVTPNLMWDYSHHQNLAYRFYPAHSGAGTRAMDNGDSKAALSSGTVLYKDFYVRTVADTTLRIAAKITRDDGSVFISSASKEGSVTLIPVEVPRYGPEDYNFNPITISSNNVAYDYIPLSLDSVHGAVEFRSVSFTDSSAVKHIVTRSGAGTLVLTGFTFPGGTQIHYSNFNSVGPRHIDPSYALPGRPVIVVVRAFNTPPAGLPSLRRSTALRAIDMYGNPHTVNILFSETETDSRVMMLY
jgi:hypothetical protein